MKDRLHSLGAALSTLVGDCVLTAAVVTYGCVLPGEQRTELVRRWIAILQEHNVTCDPSFSVSKFMAISHRDNTLLPKKVILDEGMQESVYAVSLVRPLRKNMHKIVQSD